ncbi:MAG: hypothetical protein E7521_08500 [Ruminococcaceae bacterium]|nr:hypothetical protein [Oscillospiraceae bacterium]
MKTKAIIRQIAKEHGVSPEEVKRDMQYAIKEAMKSTDPIARAHWAKISPNGKEPTIEQFLTYVIGQINKQPVQS